MFQRKDLHELLTGATSPAISLYLPTVVAGREVRQNPIRLKNLLARAAEQLRADEKRSAADELLAPAAALVEDNEFWRRQEKGLAVFLARGFSRTHRLPLDVAEETVIGPEFHIKPLLPLLDDAGPFWLLTITAGRTRLFRGARWDFTEIVADLPQGIEAVGGSTQYQQTHSAAPTGRHTGGLAKAQPLGDTPEELRKTELIELLRRIAAAIEARVAASPATLIVAAAPEIQGHFREIARPKDILPQGIADNPDALRLDELHRRAYALLEAKSAAARRGSLDRLNTLLGNGDGRATIRLAEIVKASSEGRVDTLFVTGDEHLWGCFDTGSGHVVAHGSAAPGDIDLLDHAAVLTLRQGGEVAIVDAACLPRQTNVAAILRY